MCLPEALFSLWLWAVTRGRRRTPRLFARALRQRSSGCTVRSRLGATTRWTKSGGRQSLALAELLPSCGDGSEFQAVAEEAA